jgi:hypothetical protein
MTLAGIVQELHDRSREPLPQNVVHALEDWGEQAGVLWWYSSDGRLTSRRPELLDRFMSVASLRIVRRGSPGAHRARVGRRPAVRSAHAGSPRRGLLDRDEGVNGGGDR